MEIKVNFAKITEKLLYTLYFVVKSIFSTFYTVFCCKKRHPEKNRDVLTIYVLKQVFKEILIEEAYKSYYKENKNYNGQDICHITLHPFCYL